MTRPRLPITPARLLALLAATLLACTTDDGGPGRDAPATTAPTVPTAPTAPTSATRLAEPADAIGPALMVALSQAKNFHHKAKVYMADGNLAEAITQVRTILVLPFPAGAAEADDVKLDARALLAKLLLAQGHLDDALAVVDEGVAMTRRESFFLANLFTVKGELHEARAAAIAPSDDAARAAAARERHLAITAFDRSIAINTTLQQQLTRALPGPATDRGATP